MHQTTEESTHYTLVTLNIALTSHREVPREQGASYESSIKRVRTIAADPIVSKPELLQHLESNCRNSRESGATEIYVNQTATKSKTAHPLNTMKGDYN